MTGLPARISASTSSAAIGRAVRPGGTVASTLGAADPHVLSARQLTGANIMAAPTREVIESLAGQDPWRVFKPLHDELERFRGVRRGEYRVILRIDEEQHVVRVLRVDTDSISTGQHEPAPQRAKHIRTVRLPSSRCDVTPAPWWSSSARHPARSSPPSAGR